MAWGRLLAAAESPEREATRGLKWRLRPILAARNWIWAGDAGRWAWRSLGSSHVFQIQKASTLPHNRTGLNIDMCLIFLECKKIMRYNPLIVKLDIVLPNNCTVVPPAIQRVPFRIKCCLTLKWLRVPL